MKYLFKPFQYKIFIFSNKLFLFLILSCLIVSSVNGQQKKISEKFKKETILKIDSLIQKEYIFPEKAKLMGDHLKKAYKENKFKKYDLLDSFAVALTKEIRFINNDKHLRIKPKFIPEKDKANSTKDSYEVYLHNLTDNRKLANGFKEVKIIDGNIGYLKFNYFIEETEQTIDSYMELLSKTDAIVVDLRTNGGGSPKTVQYLCSYFFKQPLLLNTLYFRKGNFTEEFKVIEVSGKKRTDVPLFIITGARTFSGAEEFSYNMQTQKRATLVGEVTGGGANPGDILEVNSLLEIFIPTGTAINPITKTNWEGIGVIPEYKTTKDSAYNKTIELAAKAAEGYRNKISAESKKLYTELQSAIDQQTKPLNEADSANIDQQILAVVKKLTESDLFSEDDIATLSSDYTKTKPFITESILKSNTELHPKSPIAFLKYGDLLEQNGKKDQAIAILKKAVEIATEIKAPYLEGLKSRYEKILK
ncbi:S41 family peptidase [Flavobacterium collinsii]|uniref:TPR_REGION domain-containing protein n=1 Tax=Flavobacterium collinsii TaxID=1114861 RepID=A0A9W4THU6_9FLAO|nr:S41 family peptidase [Flavobacterium collinsii]CAI2767174.1 TPR_REGION domain-containing protein [Flavobacterium collinsii]